MQDIAVMLARYLPKLALPQVLRISVHGLDQIHPCIYTAEGYPDSSWVYFYCICFPDEHHSLDREEFVYCVDHCSDHYFSARAS